VIVATRENHRRSGDLEYAIDAVQQVAIRQGIQIRSEVPDLVEQPLQSENIPETLPGRHERSRISSDGVQP
jgi:hypothetical protein